MKSLTKDPASRPQSLLEFSRQFNESFHHQVDNDADDDEALGDKTIEALEGAPSSWLSRFFHKDR